MLDLIGFVIYRKVAFIELGFNQKKTISTGFECKKVAFFIPYAHGL
jgi:hypothetical protein